MFTKSTRFSVLFFTFFLFVNTIAYAGVLGSIKNWITGELAQLALAALAAILSVGLAVLAKKYSAEKEKVQQTFKEFGEFLGAIADATADEQITKEELACIWKEGKDIFAVWK